MTDQPGTIGDEALPPAPELPPPPAAPSPGPARATSLPSNEVGERAEAARAAPAAVRAAEATGQDPGKVRGVLLGPPPADERTLVRLADELDALVRAVGAPEPGTAGAGQRTAGQRTAGQDHPQREGQR